MPLPEYIDPFAPFFFYAVSVLDADDTFFDADGGIFPHFSPWDFSLSSLDRYLVVDGRDFGSSDDIGAPSPLACTAGLLGQSRV
ncbi:predicted protein [Chaetoceros tenuissimus]|uniref:Uncharacterized protein n=1 Tax=Chaetoceros tenuissimus TaxID=426638 RepID=A0AAD3DCZ5_9STRA|nr:predicted protein [Chaetoceros tenuissimus]